MRAALAAVIAVMTIGGCTATPQQKLAADLVSPDSLTVCVSLLGSLAAARDQSGQLAGYNIDFANDIAAKLNLKPVFAETAFSDLLTKVQSHACDVSISSQNTTATRLQQVDFVPYRARMAPRRHRPRAWVTESALG